MTELDSHFHAQETEVARDQEIARVLACQPKDYFAVLQINPLVNLSSLPATTKKAFRKKSLQIHPDKVKNKDAPKAFDLLKRANVILLAEPQESSYETSKDHDHEKVLAEEKARHDEKINLILIYTQVADGIGHAVTAEYYHESNVDIREKVRLVLDQHEKDQETEVNFMQRQELRKQSEIQTAARDREQKRTWESQWELGRDGRVKLWRKFSAKVGKPKKKKKVLI